MEFNHDAIIGNVHLCSTFLILIQCHESCIAIYSSMENKKLSHWIFISVVSMIFCLVIYSLTGKLGGLGTQDFHFKLSCVFKCFYMCLFSSFSFTKKKVN